MQSRRWLGGNDLHLLTMNGFSINPNKYSEDFNKENKTSILMIHNFDIMDINVPYECIYGSSTFVKILNLTEDIFEYHKSGPYVGSFNITDTNVLSVDISIERVYPRPKCSAAINDEDISSYLTTTAILKGLFYCAIITITILLTPASCPGLLSITCEIGTYLSVYEKNVTCNKIISDKNQENTGMEALIIILSVTSFVILMAACMCFKKVGHFVRDCQNESKCSFCNKNGHVRNDCADFKHHAMIKSYGNYASEILEDDSVDHYNILVGDFNCTLDKKTIDRNPSHSRDDIGTKELLFLLSQYDLTDIWRDRYPKDKRYTFQRGNSKSRIDYIFCDKSLSNKVYNVGISHCPFSDHDLVSFKLKLDEIQRGPGIWIMNINTIKSEEFKNAFEIWWKPGK
ncbi:unnamed protein product [Mytilus coruscus]|uniref:CCHC-type domain-containing protein n=1 Tax=Mytilus coruscus TaxID=42192 RepID=A0A6J8EW54_MYTCO|nr:unnamed protein product [Mytilus coruscus]